MTPLDRTPTSAVVALSAWTLHHPTCARAGTTALQCTCGLNEAWLAVENELGIGGDWPTRSVQLNHIEAMGIAMSLMAEQQRDGLSQPQIDALAKIQAVLSILLAELR